MKNSKTIAIGFLISLLLGACSWGGSNPLERDNFPSGGITVSTSFPEVLTSSSTPSPQPEIIDLPTKLSPSSTPETCQSESGRIEKRQFRTNLLPAPLNYRVYLPPCYDFNLDQRYPVLYLIHGYGYNDDQWERLGVGEISDKLISDGEMSPTLIVMPHDSDHNVQPPTNQFGNSVIFDLVDEIDTSFRTLPARKFRAIGGLSRGGNWALHIGLRNWDTFSIIGGHSSPLFVTDGPPAVRTWLMEIPSDVFPRIFVDVGDHDKWLDHIIRFEEILDEFNVPHELYIFPGGHTEDYWGSHTEQYLRWYTMDWQPTN